MSGLKFRRVWGILLRHLYLLKHSFSRWLDLLYWPTVDLLLWGFITLYLQRESQTGISLASLFLGALIFWNILIRAQQGLAVGFLEDIWARNLLHLFVSPLKVSEYILGLFLYSLFKAVLASGVMSLLSIFLFHFNFFSQGLYVFYLTFGLILFAWAIGLLTIAFILYFGQEAEILAWALALFFLPFSAVFYPVSALPPFFQKIASFVPASYFFESFRFLMLKAQTSFSMLIKGYLLTIIYLLLSSFVFILSFKKAQSQGKLIKIGE
ncbi:ABC transporter [Caldimicrobium thiodismutans]|jgi:ABC-2 type transport system permease protein|uniref:Transport permease protein n=1 Tax=Caldimicrobium thiodismutans TaxID=1653476 RepID=A0A0U5AGT7_9BACT|nr:ABC transporter permease [Caldimicrobium thiodismutans]BAU23219.1 ABC transporter [Caldimicrobium thiodismutans]